MTVQRALPALLVLGTLLAGPVVAQTAQADPAGPIITNPGLSAAPAEAPVTAAEAPLTPAPDIIEPADLPPLSVDAVAAQLMPLLRQLPSVRWVGPHPDVPGAVKIIAAREMQVNLATVTRLANEPGADRAGEIARFAAIIGDLIRTTDPFADRTLLRVIIRPSAAVDAFEAETAVEGEPNRVLRRPFAVGLDEVVVAESPTSIVFMPVGRLQDMELGAAQAFDIARENTAGLAARATWSEENGLRVATLDGSFETSLLAVDRLWDALAADMGGPLAVAAPRRDRLVIGRADRSRDMARLRALLAAETSPETALAPTLLIRQGGAWRAP